MKTKEEILRKHLAIFLKERKEANIEDTPVSVFYNAMEEYAQQQMFNILSLLPSDDTIEKNGMEGGLRDNELQMFWEGAEWTKNYILKRINIYKQK